MIKVGGIHGIAGTMPALVLTIVALAGGCAGAASPIGEPGRSPAEATEPASQRSASPRSGSPAASLPPPEATLALFPKLPASPLDTATAVVLQAVLDDMVAQGAPDAIAAVVTPDGSWAGAAGVGGPDGRAATAADAFAIASVTKIFTAAVVMRLVEKGEMDLDALLSSYLGGIHDANGATVHQALQMRSGLADFGPDAAVAIAADPAHDWTPAELVARFPDAVSAPGDSYVKASPNYILLALAVEGVTGRSFGEVLRSEVLDPVGMTRVLEQGAGVDTPMPWALPTEANIGAFELADLGAGGAISCISSASFGPGSGSIASDAPSLAAWTWRLFAGDVVAVTSLATMLPSLDSPGIGIESLSGLGQTAIGQTGGKTGYGTILAVFPADQTVVALFVNDPSFVVESFVVDLLEATKGSRRFAPNDHDASGARRAFTPVSGDLSGRPGFASGTPFR